MTEKDKKKIEIELDVERIHREVVENLTNMLHYDAKLQMQHLVKAHILAEVMGKVHELTAEILATLVMPDGRSFKEFVLEKIQGVRRPEDQAFDRKSRIETAIDSAIYNLSNMWWREMVQPHLDIIKPRIQEEFVNRLLRGG